MGEEDVYVDEDVGLGDLLQEEGDAEMEDSASASKTIGKVAVALN